MQPISDKNFDKLFQDRLNAMEIEPPAHVWPEIEKQLKNKKMPFPVLWLAAACLAAVIAAGLLFAPGREPIKLTGTANRNVEEIVPANISPKPVDISLKDQRAMPVIQVQKAVEQKPVYVATKTQVTPKKEIAVARNTERSDLPAEKSRVLRPEPVARRAEANNPEAPVIANAVVEEPTPEVRDEASTENRNSKSVVSSVVNFVVGKVDKRKDKIIELEHNDEGTKVKSMNLILLKFKSKD